MALSSSLSLDLLYRLYRSSEIFVTSIAPRSYGFVSRLALSRVSGGFGNCGKCDDLCRFTCELDSYVCCSKKGLCSIIYD